MHGNDVKCEVYCLSMQAALLQTSFWRKSNDAYERRTSTLGTFLEKKASFTLSGMQKFSLRKRQDFVQLSEMLQNRKGLRKFSFVSWASFYLGSIQQCRCKKYVIVVWRECCLWVMRQTTAYNIWCRCPQTLRNFSCGISISNVQNYLRLPSFWANQLQPFKLDNWFDECFRCDEWSFSKF